MVPGPAGADMSDNPEVATKIELAMAYEEMGDRDGARELFQEALAEGSLAQQKVARAKLDGLGRSTTLSRRLRAGRAWSSEASASRKSAPAWLGSTLGGFLP